jgi:tetratricopeptide (TPR) repeat protein
MAVPQIVDLDRMNASCFDCFLVIPVDLGDWKGSVAAEAVRRTPGEKNCQWILMKTAGHACWDWNMSNHTAAIDFWREIADAEPEMVLPQEFLIDNLLADRRADEAEKALERLSGLKNFKPVLRETYLAHIALARCDEQEADRIIANMLSEYPENSDALFEAAQYYASKTEYEKAIACYEKSFEHEERRPRFQDALMAVSDIYRIMGDYQKAADTCGRIISLLKDEWGMSGEVELKDAIDRKNALLAKI